MSFQLNGAIRALRDLVDPLRRGTSPPFLRRFERRECAVLGAMEVVETGADYAGVIMEVSQGGCSFRPASYFLLDRTGETVLIRCEYFSAEGRIRATRPESYGVQFTGEVDGEAVDRLLAAHGGPIGDSELGRRG